MKDLMIVVSFLLATAGAAIFLNSPGYGPQQAAYTYRPSVTERRANLAYGEAVALGDGYARAWVRLGASGRPEAIGMALSEFAVNGLPGAPAHVALPLPAAAGATPFRYLALDWNPQGHEPRGVYDVPHFDFHFYLIDDAQRRAIGANDPGFAVAPPAGALPRGYVQTPGGVPQMGAHWVEEAAPEFLGKRFTATLVYGSHDGQVTFLEPMVTMLFLASKPSFTGEVRQPRTLPGTPFPTRYSVRFNEQAREYRIALEGLSGS